MQDDAVGRVERGGKAVRDRVRHRDDFEVEGTDLTPFAVHQRVERRALQQTRLLDAVSGQPERQGRAIDRERDLAQEVRKRADVILVAMSEQTRVDPVDVLAQEREVGQHEVDAGHVDLGKHEAAVEEEQPPLLLDDRAVAADLPEPAQEVDPDGVSHAAGSPRASGPRPPAHRGPGRWGGGTDRRRDPARGSWPWSGWDSERRRRRGTPMTGPGGR